MNTRGLALQEAAERIIIMCCRRKLVVRKATGKRVTGHENQDRRSNVLNFSFCGYLSLILILSIQLLHLKSW